MSLILQNVKGQSVFIDLFTFVSFLGNIFREYAKITDIN